VVGAWPNSNARVPTQLDLLLPLNTPCNATSNLELHLSSPIIRSRLIDEGPIVSHCQNSSTRLLCLLIYDRHHHVTTLGNDASGNGICAPLQCQSTLVASIPSLIHIFPVKMPLCSLCQTTLDVLSIPKLAPDWNRWPVTSKKYTSLVYILNSRLIGIYREEKQTTGRNVDPVGLPFHTSLNELHVAAKDCAICSIVERDVARFQAEFEAQQNDVSVRPELGGPSWKLWIARGKSDTGGFMVVSADKERDFRIWVVSAVGLCVDCKSRVGRPPSL
jgi:hypothetical protein